MYMFINDVSFNAKCFMYVHIKMHRDMYGYLTVQ